MKLLASASNILVMGNISGKVNMRTILWVVIAVTACGACNISSSPAPATETTVSISQPTLEADPITAGDDGYKIVEGDSLKLSVNANGAQEIELFYQPVMSSDRALRLRTLPSTGGNGMFVTDMQVPADFNGEIWARAKYPSGEFKETDRLLIARRDDVDGEPKTESTNIPPSISNSNIANANSAHDSPTADQKGDTEESARSDQLTKGRIERSSLKAGEGNVRITVNVPAFTMTLWQNDKEVGTYYVGVGRKKFPIPVGMRSADRIILNPDWIPPNSEWVRQSENVEPYERIPADDPENPLGKIKIPLGNAYLLHEAQAPSDIGNLVSHGCVRVLSDDLFEITQLIAQAQGLQITRQEIAAARSNTDRRVIDLNGEIAVDINYDSMGVEKGVLTIYPDVYERGTNTIEKLREELESYGLAVSQIDNKTLEEMLSKTTQDQKFVIPIADIKAGNGAAKGKTEPLTPQQAKGNG